MKQRIPKAIYSKEFREQAVKQVTDEGLSAKEAARRLSLPPSTLANWVKIAQTGKLGEIGKTRRPLTEVELELAKLKRELALAENGVNTSVYRVKRIRRKLGIRCRQKLKFKATTNSNHTLPVAPNLLAQKFATAAPNQVWLNRHHLHPDR